MWTVGGAKQQASLTARSLVMTRRHGRTSALILPKRIHIQYNQTFEKTKDKNLRLEYRFSTTLERTHTLTLPSHHLPWLFLTFFFHKRKLRNTVLEISESPSIFSQGISTVSPTSWVTLKPGWGPNHNLTGLYICPAMTDHIMLSYLKVRKKTKVCGQEVFVHETLRSESWAANFPLYKLTCCNWIIFEELMQCRQKQQYVILNDF